MLRIAQGAGQPPRVDGRQRFADAFYLHLVRGGEGARLVEDDGIDLRQPLDHARVLEVEPGPGQQVQRGAGGEWRGQGQGAGAGDDQHRGEDVGRRTRVAGQPEERGQGGDSQDCRGEVAADCVDGRYEPFFLLLAERFVIPQAGKVPLRNLLDNLQVYRDPSDPSAGIHQLSPAALHRLRLAGHVAVVHLAGGCPQPAVGRHQLAAAHPNRLADCQGRHGNRPLFLALLHGHGQGKIGPVVAVEGQAGKGAALHELADQQEEDQPGERVHIPAADTGQNLVQAAAVQRGDPQRDGHIDGHCAAPEAPPGRNQVLGAAVEEDRQREEDVHHCEEQAPALEQLTRASQIFGEAEEHHVAKAETSQRQLLGQAPVLEQIGLPRLLFPQTAVEGDLWLVPQAGE